MAKAEHTKGPWEHDGILVTDKDRKILAVVQECDADDPELTPEEIANARLIAAAPELLEALELLLKQCEKIEEARCQSFHDCDLARAAIAKARGQQ